MERAKIIKECLAGIPVVQLARELNICSHTVIVWRKRFTDKGIEGLRDRSRSGKNGRKDTSVTCPKAGVSKRNPPKEKRISGKDHERRNVGE